MPLPGISVQWNVVFGDAELVAGGITPSDAEGIATNRLRLGSREGLVQVAVRVAGSDTSEIFTAKIDREADPTRQAFDRACDDTLSNLDGLCAYVDRLGEEQQEQVRAAIEPNEVAAQATLAQEAARNQLDHVSTRLATLRHGGAHTLDQWTLTLHDRDATVAEPAATSQEAGRMSAEGSRTRDRRLGFFAAVSASSGERPRTIEEAGFELDSQDATLGIDYRLASGTLLGLALGRFDGEADFFDDGGELTVEHDWISLYVARAWDGGAYAQLIAAAGRGDYEPSRNLDLPVAFRGKSRFVADSATEGEQLAAELEVGYGRKLASELVLTGFVRGRFAELSIDGYVETGDRDGAGFYLEILDQDLDSVLIEGGFDLAWPLRRSWGSLVPQMRLSML
ncbi:MAG: autotransporter domain-containing protein, partial [Holophagales bacterium]|nr:autotransporter domain-containing protein [Holophagales bacterium]